MEDQVGSISTWVAMFGETEMAALSSRQQSKSSLENMEGAFRSLCVKGIVSTLSVRERGGAWYLVGSTPLRRLVGPSPFSSSFPHSPPDLNTCLQGLVLAASGGFCFITKELMFLSLHSLQET